MLTVAGLLTDTTLLDYNSLSPAARGTVCNAHSQAQAADLPPGCMT